MESFLTQSLDYIASLVWSDWLTMLVILAFIVSGYKKGLARESVNLFFLLLAIFIAWLFYQPLANIDAITWFSLSSQTNLAISFILIFILMIGFKRFLYFLTNYPTKVSNPCVLNRPFMSIVLITLALTIGWQNAGLFISINVIESLFTNQILIVVMSFLVISLSIILLMVAISKIFGISVDASKGCILENFYGKIFSVLNQLDGILHAKNIQSRKNNLLGLFMGIIKGSIFIIILVMALQNVSFISQQYFWVETQGALRFFQDTTNELKPFLGNYLLFIGDS